jgi:hypothetical protein
VAWLSNDVFYSSLCPRSSTCCGPTTLRWVQSAGAGVGSPMFQELIGRGSGFDARHQRAHRRVCDRRVRLYQQPERGRRRPRSLEWRRTDFREIWGTGGWCRRSHWLEIADVRAFGA